eukprot:TRINITY_DN1648_c4_g1_i1.p1 TRINITY_DN1648_c4_g1~~TRINITY_DN1648_c4_g1_i1.p1  ORF type:complete len:360 (-),score=179.90 TRINITY_DN1648_c4_g1_i1:151-1179(-)
MIEELFNKAQQHFEQLEFEECANTYRQILFYEANNTFAMDSLAEVLIELNDTTRALELLDTSCRMQPNENPFKYLTMAQLLEGTDSLSANKKGIELLENQRKQILEGKIECDIDEITKQIASGYAAVAELYLTDLCCEQNAEQECERCVNCALELDPNSIDALQTCCSLKISQCKSKEESLAPLLKSFHIWKEAEESPSASFKQNSAKLFMELEQYEHAITVLQILVDENDEEIQSWYYLGICHENIKEYIAATDALTRAKELFDKAIAKNQSIDTELHQTILQLLDKLAPLTQQEEAKIKENENGFGNEDDLHDFDENDIEDIDDIEDEQQNDNDDTQMNN